MHTPAEKSPWPSIGLEERPWYSVHDYGSQRLASGPYMASVPAFISDLDLTLDTELHALTEEAASELARFDTEVGQMAAPFASILLLAESAASSKIEHVTSSAREIALAELGVQASEDAQLIVGNVRAMHAALARSESIDGTAILEMHRALLEHSNPDIVGHWRDQQVWIGSSSLWPHTAQFVPPHQDLVPALMDDLVAFTNRVDLPVLAQTAIAHAQFETIHPFPDGNGRTGRALIQAMLRGGQLTRNVAVPVSAGLLHDTGRYFDALSAYRAGDVAPIIRSIAYASFAAVHNGRILVADLESVQAEWRGRIRARQDSAVHRLVGILLRQPVIGAAATAAQLGVSTVNAQVAIDRLVDAGVLTQITDGRRNRIWLSKDVVRVLDEFAARAKRRQ